MCQWKQSLAQVIKKWKDERKRMKGGNRSVGDTGEHIELMSSHVAHANAIAVAVTAVATASKPEPYVIKQGEVSALFTKPLTQVTASHHIFW